MKRRLGRLFARVKGAVKRVWHRFFPPDREDGAAFEPPPPPKLVRAYDGVEDADYEEVRSSGIPPVATLARDAAPVAPPPPSPSRDGQVEDTVVADLIAKVDEFLASDPPLARDEDVTIVSAPAQSGCEVQRQVASEPVVAVEREVAVEAEPQSLPQRTPEPEAEIQAASQAELEPPAAAADEAPPDRPNEIAEKPAVIEAPPERREYEAPHVVIDRVRPDASVRRIELAPASSAALSDWYYETAPLAAIDTPSAEDAPALTISAAEVDALLAPAPPGIAAPLGVESIAAAAPPEHDERVLASDPREEHVELTAHDLGLVDGVTSEPADLRVDADARAHHDTAREEDAELTAAALGLVRDETLAAPAEPEGIVSTAATAAVDNDARADAGEPREEHAELTARDLGLLSDEALPAETEAPVTEIDGEPASAEDVAVVAELDAAIAAAEAAATIPNAAPQVASETANDPAPLAAAADDDEAAKPVVPAGFNPVPKVEIPSDYIPIAESVHQLYQLSLGGFEGPLDLLLFLIKRHQIDIFDIPVAFICERYLECIKVMEDLDIDVAAEFLFMASELLHLKSRLLLPKPEAESAEDEEIDPRAELVRRLLEYQKYKDAADRFGALDRFNRDTFGREPEPIPVVTVGEAPLKEVGLFALVKAFEAVLKRQKPEVRHQVMMEQVSVRKRIRALLQMMESQEPLSFETLLEGHTRKIDIVVTFLALLEMGKLKFLRIFQDDSGMIYVHPKFDDVSVAFQRLEGMDESQYAG